MGDGTIYQDTSVTHTYASTSTYTISVQLIGSTCSDKTLTTDWYAIVNTPCSSRFRAYPQQNNSNLFMLQALNANSVNVFNSVVMDYGDGTVDTVSNLSVQHAYAAVGNYQACLTVQDTGGCTNTFCDSVSTATSPTGVDSITGNVYHVQNETAFSIDHAVVYLIQHDPVVQSLTAVDSVVLTPADSGQYSFQGLAPGVYFLKAAPLPADPAYGTTLPTYCNLQSQWVNATGVVRGYSYPPSFIQDIFPRGIILRSGTNPGGPGFVGGQLSNGANKTLFDDVPVENVSVQLHDAQTQALVAHTYSDAQGAFALDNLPYGTYRLHAEVLGRNTLDELVTIGPDNPSVDDIDMSLAPQGLTSSRAQLSAPAASIIAYPNPTTGELTLSVDSQAPEVLQIELIDLTGRSLLRTDRRVQSGQQQLRLDLGELPSGLYQLHVSGSQTRYTQKVVVQRQ